jgi:serine protease Do
MTHGIVSALNRQAGILGPRGYEQFIQVDAPINPGNSGGPLVNLHGEVIGVNTAIASRSGGFQGIGFAIPSNQAKFVYGQLKSKGKVTRGWLGVAIANVNQPEVAPIARDTFGYKGNDGIFVQEVMNDTPATGKLKNGDVITKLNGKPTRDVTDLRNEIASFPPKTEVTLTVFRDGKDQEVKLTLGEQPEDLASSRSGRGGSGGESGSADAEAANAKTKLGVTLGDLTDELAERFGLDKGIKGAVVREVDPRSPAARAGIRPGDVITDVAKHAVSNAKEAREQLAKADPAKGITLYVVSREGSRFVRVEASEK